MDGRPLLLVYRPSLLPDAARTAEIWRRYCREAGLGELYLATVQSFGNTGRSARFRLRRPPVEFPPHAMAVLAEQPANLLNPDFQGRFFAITSLRPIFSNRPPMPYPFFRTAMPSWDNTARRQDASDIFLERRARNITSAGSKHLVDETRQFRQGDERLLFVNAWNEWAEGNISNRDRKFGHRYLETTRNALGSLGC